MSRVRPYIAVGQALIRSGHDVSILAVRSSPELEELGFTVVEVTFPRKDGDAPPVAAYSPAEVVSVTGDRSRSLEWVGWMTSGLPKLMVEPMRELIREAAPDVMAIDPLFYGMMLAARLEKIPHAGLMATLLGFTSGFSFPHAELVEEVSGHRTEMLAHYGLEPQFVQSELLAPELNISFATNELLGNTIEPPANTLLVGTTPAPVLRGQGDDFPWEQLGDGPVVYVAFGSVYFWQPELLSVFCDAIHSLGAQAVVGCGKLAHSEEFRSRNPNALLVEFAPQPVLLEKVDVFVTHGGAASLFEASWHGVPMIVVPANVYYDQPATAQIVSKVAKTGVAMSASECTFEACRESLAALLAPGNSYRERATIVMQSFREKRGAEGAAAALVELHERMAVEETAS